MISNRLRVFDEYIKSGSSDRLQLSVPLSRERVKALWIACGSSVGWDDNKWLRQRTCFQANFALSKTESGQTATEQRSERCEPTWNGKQKITFALFGAKSTPIYIYMGAHTHTYTYMCIRYTNLCLAIKLILMPHASVIFLGKSRKSYKEIGARTLSQARSVNGGQQINMFNRQMGIKSTRIEEDICHAAELQLATCNVQHFNVSAAKQQRDDFLCISSSWCPARCVSRCVSRCLSYVFIS